MVRLRGRDNLDDVTGQLGADFRSVGLASLHLSFFAAAADPDKKNAAQTLDHFYRVASKLCIRENEFNKRARSGASMPSLMAHLRDPAHFTALREFSKAKAGLLEINTTIGQRIIHLVEKHIDVSARTSARAVPSATII